MTQMSSSANARATRKAARSQLPQNQIKALNAELARIDKLEAELAGRRLKAEQLRNSLANGEQVTTALQGTYPYSIGCVEGMAPATAKSGLPGQHGETTNDGSSRQLQAGQTGNTSRRQPRSQKTIGSASHGRVVLSALRQRAKRRNAQPHIRLQQTQLRFQPTGNRNRESHLRNGRRHSAKQKTSCCSN